MDYLVFLARVVDEGIAAASESYANSPNKLAGARAGFEACQGKTAGELRALYVTANKVANERMYIEGPTANDSYWYMRCFAAEVEWVCNVVSAAFYSLGVPPLLAHQPSARGMLQAAKILGVKDSVLVPANELI